MRLIDSEKLKHRVNNSKYYGTERQRDFCDMIAESETIDAVEVVRCRDCKYWHSNTEFCNVWSYSNVARRTLGHDYCSRGERREESEVDE